MIRITCFYSCVPPQRRTSNHLFPRPKTTILTPTIAVDSFLFPLLSAWWTLPPITPSAMHSECSLQLKHSKQHLQVTSCPAVKFVSVFISNLTALTPNDSQSSVFSSLTVRQLWSEKSRTLTDWNKTPCELTASVWFGGPKRLICRSQWPRGLRRGSSAARLLRLWVRIPPGAWMFVCCESYVLSGRGLCDGLITRPEESYRLWRVVVCDQETSKTRRLKPATGLWNYSHSGL